MQFSESFDPETGTWTVCEVRAGKLLPWVEVRPSKIKGAGLGVFASRNFRVGTLLGAYAGEMVPFKDIVDGTYALDAGHNVAIDGCFHGNWTRFMNDGEHGRRRPRVNVLWYEKGNTFLACRYIRKGDEMCISYGTEYWDAMKRTRRQQRRGVQTQQKASGAPY